MKIIKKISETITDESIRTVIRLVPNDYVLETDEEEVRENKWIEKMRVMRIINYRKQRDIYKYLIETFTEQSTEIKDAICKFCATNSDAQISTVIIPYYVSKGMTFPESISQYRKNRAVDITKAATDCAIYAQSPKIIELLIEFLPFQEVERFVVETIDLVDMYSRFAVFGTNYGNSINGLMDYIDSTGLYNHLGLISFQINPGKTLPELIEKLKDILIEGNI